MVRSILVGLDGSAYSTNALTLGIRWARQYGAILVGLGVVDEPAIRQPVMASIGGDSFKQGRDESVLAVARESVKKCLDDFSSRCRAEGVKCTAVEAVGEPYEQIVLEAQRYDLVLLGQQTFFRFASQEDACDTLKSVLQNTPRPVVTAPENLLPGTSVLIAFDGRLQAARALQAFQSSGLAESQQVHVVSVADEKSDAERIAARAVEFLRLHDIKAEPHALESSQADHILLAQARELNAGLIVMGTYGQSTIREFFLGSVTRSLLESSPVPLFLYH